MRFSPCSHSAIECWTPLVPPSNISDFICTPIDILGALVVRPTLMTQFGSPSPAIAQLNVAPSVVVFTKWIILALPMTIMGMATTPLRTRTPRRWQTTSRLSTDMFKGEKMHCSVIECLILHWGCMRVELQQYRTTSVPSFRICVNMVAGRKEFKFNQYQVLWCRGKSALHGRPMCGILRTR